MHCYWCRITFLHKKPRKKCVKRSQCRWYFVTTRLKSRSTFKLIIIILWKSMQILFTDREQLTITSIRQMDQIWGEKVSPCSPKIMVGCSQMFISSFRFHPSLTGLAVHATEECQAMAEMTLSSQVDLVWSDTAATSMPQLVESVQFCIGYAPIWLKCVWHPPKVMFMRNCS